MDELRWHDRVRVATEVCRALLFLHKRKPEGIIHRDIKPSNVLLDGLWTAKLSDVGLSKILSSEAMTSMRQRSVCKKTSKLAGTFSYMDPEYMASGQVSFSSDVYSLGMMLLHMIIGDPTDDKMTLRDLAEDAVEGKNPFVDEKAGPWPLQHALAFVQLALDCAEPRKRKRPDLEKEVLPALEKLLAECPTDSIANEHNKDRNVCVVCIDAPATHAFFPCGHKCVCQSDADTLMDRDKICPLCRMPAANVARIY